MKNEALIKVICDILNQTKQQFPESESDKLEEYVWLFLVADFGSTIQVQQIVHNMKVNDTILFAVVRETFPESQIVIVMDEVIKQQKHVC